MLFAVLMGVAVRGADSCSGLAAATCILTEGCWYDNVAGCGSDCVDMGIPIQFQVWFSNCDMICDAPNMAIAAQMFCADSCGFCPTPEPAPTGIPTEEPDTFERSYEDCSYQELQNQVTLGIYDQISDNNYDAVGPCLEMQSHLAYVLDRNDQLTGNPDGVAICACLSRVGDDNWARTHLNCQLAGFQVYDLAAIECKEIGDLSEETCDISAIEAVMSQEPACNDFGTNIANYGSFAFNLASVCGCFDAFDPVLAAKTFNCMHNGKQLMELYTDGCPAYIEPCDRDEIEEAMTEEIIKTMKIEQLAGVCTEMSAHFTSVLDPATGMLYEDAYADFALICQCLRGFSRNFVDDHFRCGLGGHHAYQIWRQCSEHTPQCKDMTCEQCDSTIRCSMSTDGTCKTSCPADGTCFDDPAVSKTCADL